MRVGKEVWWVGVGWLWGVDLDTKHFRRVAGAIAIDKTGQVAQTTKSPDWTEQVQHDI